MRRKLFGDAWEVFRVDASRWLQPELFGDPDDVDVRQAIWLLVRHRQLRAVAWFRFGGWGRAAGVKGIAWLADQRLQGKYGLDIPISTDVGPGFYLAHPTGVAITATQIGANATLVGALTIGVNGAARPPTLGEQVYVGAGARIIGDVHVGNRVVVGANAVVVRDVADDLTVVGAPAKPTAKSLLAAANQPAVDHMDNTPITTPVRAERTGNGAR